MGKTLKDWKRGKRAYRLSWIINNEKKDSKIFYIFPTPTFMSGKKSSGLTIATSRSFAIQWLYWGIAFFWGKVERKSSLNYKDFEI